MATSSDDELKPAKPAWHYITVIAIAILITVIAVADLITGRDTPSTVFVVLGALAVGAPDLLRHLGGKS